jgi:hypothetical protein
MSVDSREHWAMEMAGLSEREMAGIKGFSIE